MRHLIHILRHATRHPREAWLGAREFRLSLTTHIEDEDLAEAYDSGREIAHLVTLRRCEP